MKGDGKWIVRPDQLYCDDLLTTTDVLVDAWEYRFVMQLDCNENTVPDADELDEFTDTDNDGILDECEFVCDCDIVGRDGMGGPQEFVDVFDLLAYLDLWFVSDDAAERTDDDPASIDVFDLLDYLDCWFMVTGPDGGECPAT